MTEGLMQLDVIRIVTTADNALHCQVLHDVIHHLYADRIDVINVTGVGALGRCDDFFDAGQRLVVMLCMISAELISSFEILEFDSQNSCLDSVHSGGPSDYAVVVLADLTVVSQDPDFLLQL